MSERLTKRKDDGCACWNGDQNLVTHRRYSEMLEALAKYEDVIFDADGNEVISLDRLRELASAERTKHGPQEPNPMGLQTIYFTPYSCDYCGDHIAVGWAFCPECGHRTKNKIAATEPKGDAT